MKGKLSILLCFAVVLSLLFSASPLFADQFNSSKGTQYTTSAKALSPGGKIFQFHVRGATMTLEGQSSSISNATAAAGVAYGIFENLEAEITAILYQDVNNRAETNSPDQAYFRFKYGNIRMGDQLFGGVQVTGRYTFAEYGNTYLEPYYSAASSIQIAALFSYFRNPDFPDEDVAIHFNGAYENLRDSDDGLGKSTAFIKADFGLAYPFSSNLLGLFDLHASYTYNYRSGINKIYSIENFAFMTPAIKYKLSPAFALVGGIDIRAYEAENETWTAFQDKRDDWPSYPAWRINTKIVWDMDSNSYGGYSGRRSRGRMRPQGGGGLPIGSGYDIYNRSTLYDWGGYVREDIEYVEIELDKIRADRKKAEEDLQKIKDKLKKELNPPAVEQPETPVMEEPAQEEPVPEMEETPTEEPTQDDPEEE